MRALFVQRLIVQRWTILFAITICFVLYFIRLPYLDSPFICLFVVIVSASLVENLYKGDRQVKWEVYVNNLPLSKKVQLQSDFLFCYAFVLSLYILIAPLYFSQTEASTNFIGHFAMYFGFISSSFFLLSSQFYIQQLEETEKMRSLRMLTAIVLIITLNSVVHFYLSLVAGNLIILLIPTLISIISSWLVFQKCLHLLMTREIF
ncbi:ABC-2 transporter permease [Lysinibacillus fusiformis]|uniref:ABC-2 transporter permease n=1 Tax=Lysinibacillus fusiformis TaxID=28031 RepID=UPI002E1B8E1F|nr:ABC-2 transporter permease [Lysinibacillus fusiformis]